MATRKARTSVMIKRFKGFWKDYKRSKRGMLGLIIIILYVFVALVGPLVSPYRDPNAPTMEGYYPAGEKPNIAAKLCVPIWYKYLPSAGDISENLLVIKDHEFSSDETFNTWNKQADGCTIEFNPAKGDRNDGCVEISCNKDSDEPYSPKATAKLIKDFEYPYFAPPKAFQIHFSSFLNETAPSTSLSVSVNLWLTQKNGKSYLLNKFDVHQSSTWSHRWFYSTRSQLPPYNIRLKEIFDKPRNYSYVIEVMIDRHGTEQSATIYLDNLDLILYGNAFGLLGTDDIPGKTRDIFVSLMCGARISLIVGLLAAGISTLVGLALGLVSGYLRGMVDEVTMRFADFMLVLPTLPLLIVLVMVTSPSIWNVIFILSIMGWMGFSRSIRSMVISLRERPFIEAAKAAGGGRFYIIQRHIFPNVIALVYITLATSVPGAIIAEASLSWLGLFDPSIVSWGRILYEFTNSGVAIRGVIDYWFWVIPPGVAIALLAMAFILMGYALDEILNPRLRRRR